MDENLFIAVDMGAGSGRVFLAGFESASFFFEEIDRFYYPPREEAGRLRWDFSRIFKEIESGLQKACARAKKLRRPIYSLGVDSWAVDYGLIDASGRLIANPVCYRDDRTNGVMELVFGRVPRFAIFEKTGIQFLNFNTLYQLYSEGPEIEKAEKMLLLPDLINFFLTGKLAAEYTNATTTQMLNARSRNWDWELIEDLDLPARLLPEIIPAGTDLGPLKPEIAKELNLSDVRLTAPATHDTASAVAGAPLAEDWSFISSGTWSLIGIERDDVLINDDVARQNFTNEGGVFGTIRFLKNVMGLWIFESCRKEWKAKGINTEYGRIIDEVAAIKDFPGFIFPDDERFLNPTSMLEAITRQLRETGQTCSDDPAVVSRVIFDSLAFRYASVLHTIETLTGKRLSGVQIIGGGGRNEYLNQLTADTSGLNTQAGPVEAAAMGNVLVQAIAAGRFASLAEAREYVRKNVSLKEFSPRRSPEIAAAGRRYNEIETRFVGENAVT